MLSHEVKAAIFVEQGEVAAINHFVRSTGGRVVIGAGTLERGLDLLNSDLFRDAKANVVIVGDTFDDSADHLDGARLVIGGIGFAALQHPIRSKRGLDLGAVVIGWSAQDESAVGQVAWSQFSPAVEKDPRAKWQDILSDQPPTPAIPPAGTLYQLFSRGLHLQDVLAEIEAEGQVILRGATVQETIQRPDEAEAVTFEYPVTHPFVIGRAMSVFTEKPQSPEVSVFGTLRDTRNPELYNNHDTRLRQRSVATILETETDYVIVRHSVIGVDHPDHGMSPEALSEGRVAIVPKATAHQVPEVFWKSHGINLATLRRS